MAWGLAAGGEDGLRRTMQLLQIEIRTTMANLGVSGITDLDPGLLRPASAAAGSAWPADL